MALEITEQAGAAGMKARPGTARYLLGTFETGRRPQTPGHSRPCLLKSPAKQGIVQAAFLPLQPRSSADAAVRDDMEILILTYMHCDDSFGLMYWRVN